MSPGQLQVHTAPYRSFASVLELALRAAGLGSRVMVVQFLKGGGSVALIAASPSAKALWLRPDVPVAWPSPLEQEPDTLAAVQALWNECRSQLLNGEPISWSAG